MTKLQIMNIEAKPLNVLKCDRKREKSVPDYTNPNLRCRRIALPETIILVSRWIRRSGKYRRNGGGEAANLAFALLRLSTFENSPYETHTHPGCTPHAGPTWAAHNGPI